MKNKFIFIIGLLLLIIIVWATTMIGIEYNTKKEEESFVSQNEKVYTFDNK